MLTGSFMHTVDAKGRVFVPAKFRSDLGTPIYVTVILENCIRAYSLENWKKMMDMFDRLEAEETDIVRDIMMRTYELEPDSQGRIIIPEDLRAKAGITDKCRVIGMNSWAELWAPETVEEAEKNINKQDAFAALKKVGFR